MKLHPIQTSFQGGAVSPRMLGRSDTSQYQSGVLSGKNMIVDSRGPLRSRRPTRFDFSFISECARTEILQVTANVYFNMVFSELSLAITSRTGGIPKVELVQNPRFLQGSNDWNEITQGGGSNVIFGNGLVSLNSGNGGSKYAGIQQIVNIADGLIPQEFILASLGTSDIHVRIGSAFGLSEYLDVVTSQAQFEAFFNPGIAGPLPIYVDIRAEGGDDAVLTKVSMPESSAELTFATPWDCDQVRALHFVQAPGGQSIYILNKQVQPHKLTYDVATNVFSLDIVTFEDLVGPPIYSPPPEWGPGLYDSWPGTGTIYQGRLWLMGTANEPESMWGSRSGEYEQFFVADDTNIVANDAIMNLPMEHYGQIQWSHSSKDLIVGTINGEYIITSSDGLIRPTDVQIKRQSAYGSTRIQPHQVNDQVVYVTSDHRKVRAMSFSDSTDNWESEDLLYISEHLSEARIVDIAWAKNPDNLLWCLLADGTLISCTYERSNGITGWMPHDTQGTFTDISVGEIFGASWVNLLVVRQPGVFNVEAMFPSSFGVPPMDALVQHEEAGNLFTIIDELEHLEGYSVQIVADGAVRANKTVVGGQIELDTSAEFAFVGLGYDTEFTTMPLDKGSKTGSGMSHMKRWNRIYVRLLDSAKPLINGDRPPTRNPGTPMDTPELARTEDVSVGNLGWDGSALVTVKQDLPLHLTVLAIFGELGQETL